jgi:transcriptional regulator with XRE-family HTH domain
MSQDEIRRQELSDFLRTRRARISPVEAGLPAGQRRRTPGLRREEVAQLAGVSVTWYTWLEQRRPIAVSASVLESLARVLRLSSIERTELFQLALRQPALDSTPRVEEISPLVRRLLDRMESFPALIIGARWDILAWNRAARAFMLDFQKLAAAERNLLWLTFTNSAMRSLLVDWPTRAQDILARFRADYDKHAGDPHFVQLVEHLKSLSAEFAEWWPRYDVRPHSEGRKEYNHPAVGRFFAEHITFSMTDNPELKLTVFAPVAEGNSTAKVRRIIASFRP